MKLEKNLLGHKRKDYVTWDEFFMGVAVMASKRSKDPSTAVGACIVNTDNRILSMGYNGAPNGISDDEFPWNRSGASENETKYPYVCHAEFNAILNYNGPKKDFEGSRIYVNLFPCNECAKMLIQIGIKEVIYLSDKYVGTEGNEASKYLLDACGVRYHPLESTYQKDIVISLKEENQ